MIVQPEQGSDEGDDYCAGANLCRYARAWAFTGVSLRAAQQAQADDENRLNLFNINWKNTGDSVEKIVLPKQLTGVPAR